MPRYLVLIHPAGRPDRARGPCYGPVEAPDAERAAAIASVEWFGEGADGIMRETDPEDGMPRYVVGRFILAVERLTP